MEYFFTDPQPGRQDLSAHKKTASTVGLAYFVLMLVSFAVAVGVDIIVMLFFPAIGDSPWYGVVSTILVLYGIAAPLAYLILKKLPANPPVRRTMRPVTFLIFTLMAFAFLFLGSLIGSAVNDFLSLFFGDQGTVVEDMLSDSTLWVSILYSLAVAPVMEEFFFRKLLIDRISHLGDGVAILFSGFFFGLFHGNIEQFFYAALLGFLLAYVYVNTGNIWYTVAIHSIVNFFGGILPTVLNALCPAGFATAETEEELEALTEQYPGWALLISVSNILPILIAIAGAILFFCYVSKMKKTVGPCAIPRGERASTLVGNLGVILFLLVSLAEIVLNVILA